MSDLREIRQRIARVENVHVFVLDKHGRDTHDIVRYPDKPLYFWNDDSACQRYEPENDPAYILAKLEWLYGLGYILQTEHWHNSGETQRYSFECEETGSNLTDWQPSLRLAVIHAVLALSEKEKSND